MQWADIPSMTHDAKAFSFYCHALFRNSLSDVDGALERGRFAAIMRSVHAVCGLKEDFNAVLKQVVLHAPPSSFSLPPRSSLHFTPSLRPRARPHMRESADAQGPEPALAKCCRDRVEL